MDWMEAAFWGLAGGLAAGLFSLLASIIAAGYRWPGPLRREFGPRLFVFGFGVLLGALVAVAVHSQLSGPWPAFVLGVGAPSVIRGLLSHIEVQERPTVYEQKRESQIMADAESLANAREPSQNAPSPRGVSADLADILAARREALAGELPVVRASEEGSEAS
jgi:hypothetical protein